MERFEHLRTELDKLINRFKNESEKHKLLNRKLRYLLFGLTGCATILSAAALKFTDHQTALNLGVVFVSVGAGIVSSVEGLRKPAELWILERNVFHSLNDLKRELEFDATGKPDLEPEPYFRRMQSILAASTEQWTKHIQPRSRAE